MSTEGLAPPPAGQDAFSPRPVQAKAESPGASAVAPTPKVAPIQRDVNASVRQAVRASKVLDTSDRRTNLHELAVFTRQVVTMFDAGLQLQAALSFYGSGERTTLAEVADDLAVKVSSGLYFSQALAHYPRIFSPIYVGLSRAGESTGSLGPMLEKLANLMERQDAFHKRVSSAFAYPVVLMMVGLLCSLLFIYHILPALEPLYTSMNIDLPLPTQIMLVVGQVARNPYFLGSVVGLGALAWFFGPGLLRKLRGLPRVGHVLDLLPLTLPVVGPMYRQIISARVLFSLATLIDAGLGVVESVDLAKEVAVNGFVVKALIETKLAMEQGESLSFGLAQSQALPFGAISMIQTGEEAGQLARMMMSVARIYEEGAEMAITNASQLLEPILLMFMGVFTGFLVLAAIMPIARMLQNL